jgi:hypothetical protein
VLADGVIVGVGLIQRDKGGDAGAGAKSRVEAVLSQIPSRGRDTIH